MSFIYGRCSDWNFIEAYTVQSFKSLEILAVFLYGTFVTEHSGFCQPGFLQKVKQNQIIIGSLKLLIPIAFSSLNNCNTARGCHSSIDVTMPALGSSTLRFALAEEVLQSCNYHWSCRLLKYLKHKVLNCQEAKFSAGQRLIRHQLSWMSVNTTEMKLTSCPFMCSHLTVSAAGQTATPFLLATCPVWQGDPPHLWGAITKQLMHSCALEVPPEGNLKPPTASLIPINCGDKVKEGEYHKGNLPHWRICTLPAC